MLDSRPRGLTTPWPLKSIATRPYEERCSHDPPKGGENDGSIGDKSITTENAQRTARSEQRSNLELDYPCVYGRRLTAERGMKIHRTKMGCLNASTSQQQRTAGNRRHDYNQQSTIAGERNIHSKGKTIAIKKNTKTKM